jgi:hypothetical protein
MKKKNAEFTDTQKAQIYIRDRATCAFSGRSLWNLDFGACPLSNEWDWADHIKPRSRNGKGKLDNGLCVSSLFNAKKRANGADTFSLLTDLRGKGQDAVPSKDHFEYFGIISSDWLSQLVRLRRIQEKDWFFNRAVCHIINACHISFHRLCRKRGPKYYRDSALKKFEAFRDKGGSRQDLEKRGLVQHPGREDVKILLAMIEEQKLSEFSDKLRRLKAIYAENARAMGSFWQAYSTGKLSRMQAQAVKINKNKHITPSVRAAVDSHVLFWKLGADRH